MDDVNHTQGRNPPPEEPMEEDKSIYQTVKQIWIPSEAINLKVQIAVEAQCEDKGHRAFAATMDTISEIC